MGGLFGINGSAAIAINSTVNQTAVYFSTSAIVKQARMKSQSRAKFGACSAAHAIEWAGRNTGFEVDSPGLQ